MWVNWKRCSFGVLVLAALSLLLFGCGDFGSSQRQATATKSLSGIVSDPDSGLPLAGAPVTAFAVGSDGTVSTTPLSVNPETTTSNGRGAYTLNIPADYSGSVVVEAEVPASGVHKLLKVLFAAPGTKFRCAVPQGLIAKPVIPPVMVSLATNAVYEYVKQNSAATGGLSPANIRGATLALEVFFGPNFTQTPPPASATDTNTSRAQQDLIVSIKAFSTVTTNPDTPLATIVKKLGTTGLGTDIAGAIRNGIAAATSALAAQGTLPPEYLPSLTINSAIANVTLAPVQVDVSDATPPVAPANLAVTASAAKKVDLAWTASGDSDLDGYSIWRADASGVFVTIDVVPAGTVTYSDFSVLPQTRYSYRVVAFDKTRNLSDPSNTVETTTPAATDTVAPDRPAGLQVKGFDNQQVNLQWQPTTKTNADGSVVPADHYIVYRNSVPINSNVPSNGYVDNAGVSAATPYTYFVKAVDSLGNVSPASQVVSVVTLPDPNVVVDAPASLSLATVTPPAVNPAFNNVILSWPASNTAAVTYNVYRDGVLIASRIKALSYGDGNVVGGTTYNYAVSAVSDGGESTKATLANVTTPANPNAGNAPTAPTSIVVVSNASKSVALTWTASTVATPDFVAGYIVRRGDGTGNNFVNVGTTVQPNFVDATVAPSTAYTYQVVAFSNTGARSAAATGNFVVTTPAAIDLNDSTAPTDPTNLASSATSSSVSLSWTASTDANGVAGYRIFRKPADSTGPAAQIGDVAATSFTDLNVPQLTVETGYLYQVVAYDNAGNVSAAVSATVNVPASVPGTFSIFGKVTLNGNGLGNVTLTIGNNITAVTDASGNYVFAGLANNQTYTVTPVPAEVVFAPEKRVVLISGRNVAGQNFAAAVPGSVGGSVTFPDGTVVGGVTFPDGTIVGGITYPPGSVIGGVTYPTGATVINGIVYPTGTVIGGVTYPTGVVIGGVTYPAGTVVGGIAFPPGAVVTTPNFPSGVVNGSVSYPSGIVSAGAIYPLGGVTGSLTYRYTVSGTLHSSGTSVASRTVILTDSNANEVSTTTDGSGNYSFTLVPAGNYTITLATIPGFPPTPASIAVSVVNTSVTGNDFTL